MSQNTDYEIVTKGVINSNLLMIFKKIKFSVLSDLHSDLELGEGSNYDL